MSKLGDARQQGAAHTRSREISILGREEASHSSRRAASRGYRYARPSYFQGRNDVTVGDDDDLMEVPANKIRTDGFPFPPYSVGDSVFVFYVYEFCQSYR